MRYSHIFLTLIIMGSLLLVGCWNPFGPEEAEIEDVGGILEATTPENVLSNLVFAYRQRDIDLYLQCLSKDFVFFLTQTDWQDLDNDGQVDRYWGLAKEEEFTRKMFEQAWRISLDDFRGQQQLTDPSDPTGKTQILKREFTLRVWIDETIELSAIGEATFTLAPDENNIWRITKWVDESEI